MVVLELGVTETLLWCEDYRITVSAVFGRLLRKSALRFLRSLVFTSWVQVDVAQQVRADSGNVKPCTR